MRQYLERFGETSGYKLPSAIFIGFLFRLCGLYLASIEFHFGGTNLIED